MAIWKTRCEDNIKTTLNKMAVRIRHQCNCIGIVFSDRTAYDQSYYRNHFWSQCQHTYHHLIHTKTHIRSIIQLLHTTQMLFHPVHSKANRAVVLVRGCDTTLCDGEVPILQRNLLPPSATLMKAAGPSKMLVLLYKTTWCHIPPLW